MSQPRTSVACIRQRNLEQIRSRLYNASVILAGRLRDDVPASPVVVFSRAELRSHIILPSSVLSIRPCGIYSILKSSRSVKAL